MKLTAWATLAAMCLAVPARGNLRPEPQEPGRPVTWDLRFAKGTADEVVQKLDGEADRLTALVASLADQERTLAAGLPVLEAKVAEAVRKTPAYISTKAETDKAEQVLKRARETGTSQEKLDASGRYNTLRLALQDMEKKAAKADGAVPAQQAAIAKAKAQLAPLREALAKATELRADIVSRLKASADLTWPLQAGDEGTLMAGEVLDATADGVSVRASVDQRVGREEKAEVGVNVKVVRRTVVMQVTGFDASKLRRGDKWNADGRVVRIERAVELRSGDTAYLATASDGELQSLLNKVNHRP